MADRFATNPAAYGFPARRGIAVTNSDSADMAGGPYRILPLTSGNTKVTLADDTVGYVLAVTAGQIPQVIVKRVWATGTTATFVALPA